MWEIKEGEESNMKQSLWASSERQEGLGGKIILILAMLNFRLQQANQAEMSDQQPETEAEKSCPWQVDRK